MDDCPVFQDEELSAGPGGAAAGPYGLQARSRAITSAKRQGLYDDRLARGETRRRDQLVEPGLNDEILMLRVAMRRVLALADESDGVETAIKGLSALGLATNRLAALMKTQRQLSGGHSALEATIQQAIAEVYAELTAGVEADS
jgi:hypothetical protein